MMKASFKIFCGCNLVIVMVANLMAVIFLLMLLEIQGARNVANASIDKYK